MSTDDQVTQPPWRASEKVWKGLGLIATGTAGPAGLYGCSCCILELRDRVKALEAAAKTAALLVPKEGAALMLSEDAFQALEAAGGRAPDAPAGGGLTVEQLAECLPINAWQGPEGYSRMAFARHLLSHPITGPRLRTEPTPAAAPAGGVTVEELAGIMREIMGMDCRGEAAWLLQHPRIGPLLRGDGAPAPKRLVLPERPPLPEDPTPGLTGGIYLNGYVDGWAAARAEVERQQQGGQVEEDLPSDGGYEAGTMWTGHPLRRAAASGEVERQQQGGQADG